MLQLFTSTLGNCIPSRWDTITFGIQYEWQEIRMNILSGSARSLLLLKTPILDNIYKFASGLNSNLKSRSTIFSFNPLNGLYAIDKIVTKMCDLAYYHWIKYICIPYILGIPMQQWSNTWAKTTLNEYVLKSAILSISRCCGSPWKIP